MHLGNPCSERVRGRRSSRASVTNSGLYKLSYVYSFSKFFGFTEQVLSFNRNSISRFMKLFWCSMTRFKFYNINYILSSHQCSSVAGAHYYTMRSGVIRISACACVKPLVLSARACVRVCARGRHHALLLCAQVWCAKGATSHAADSLVLQKQAPLAWEALDYVIHS